MLQTKMHFTIAVVRRCERLYKPHRQSPRHFLLLWHFCDFGAVSSQLQSTDVRTYFHRTDAVDSSCLSFFSGMSVLTLSLCARLSWLLVSAGLEKISLKGGVESRGLGTELGSLWAGSRTKPQYGVWRRSPPEAEAFWQLWNTIFVHNLQVCVLGGSYVTPTDFGLQCEGSAMSPGG